MTNVFASASGLAAAPLSAALNGAHPAICVAEAAQRLLPHLQRGQRIDAAALRAAMDSAFGGSDSEGAWDWKTAYDACEAATVLFLRKFGPAMRARAASPAALLPMLEKIAGLLPTHTRRSQESQALQQFSTPIPLGLAVSVAAAITPADVVLEPSAGTGLLAIFAEFFGASLVLNELAETRAALLDNLFLGVGVTRFDAAQIDDHLDAGVTPSVVLMNPPFSALANVDRRMADAALRHISSALSRLTDGGRLVAITGANCAFDNPAWTDAFVRIAGTRPRRFLGGDRRRCLCETRHDHRHAADRDRQNSRQRSDGVPGVAWRCARCGDIARLDHAILNRQGCRRLPVSSRQLSPNRLSRALRARS